MLQSTAEDATVEGVKLSSSHFINQSAFKSLPSQLTLSLLMSSKFLWVNHCITVVTAHYVSATKLHWHIYILDTSSYNTTAYCTKPLLIICNFIRALWKIHLCQIIFTVHLHHPSSLCIYNIDISSHHTIGVGIIILEYKSQWIYFTHHCISQTGFITVCVHWLFTHMSLPCHQFIHSLIIMSNCLEQAVNIINFTGWIYICHPYSL